MKKTAQHTLKMLVAGLALIATVACSNTSNSGSGNASSVATSSGVSGVGNVIFGGLISRQTDAQFQLNVYSNGGTQGALAGILSLANYNTSFCYSPGGQYNMTTVQAGTLTSTGLYNVVMQSTNSSPQITVVVNTANLTSSPYMPMSTVIYINNQYCGPMVFY